MLAGRALHLQPLRVCHVVRAFESVSTWRQKVPQATSRARCEVIRALAGTVAGQSPRRVRVAIDGYTAAGKTTFGHELAAALRVIGRSTARASMDDFKHTWRHSREHGHDRVTGEGYYRNAYDFVAARDLLLQPAGADGTGQVALCAFDPLTGQDHRQTVVQLPADAVLVVDTVFAFRPEYNEFWDFRIWLEVSPELSLRRGIDRDTTMEGLDEATLVHRDRYHVAESIYVDEVNPRVAADVVIDNSNYAKPRFLRPDVH
jgi:uridine kinase